MSNRLIISLGLILSVFISLFAISSPVNASDNMMWLSYGHNQDIGSSAALGVLFNTGCSFGGFKLLAGISFGTDFSGDYSSSDYEEHISESGEYLCPPGSADIGLKKIGGTVGGDLLLGLKLADFLNVFFGGGYYSKKYVRLAESPQGNLYAMDEPSYESTWTNTYGAQIFLGRKLVLGYENHSYRGEHYQLGLYGSF